MLIDSLVGKVRAAECTRIEELKTGVWKVFHAPSGRFLVEKSSQPQVSPRDADSAAPHELRTEELLHNEAEQNLKVHAFYRELIGAPPEVYAPGIIPIVGVDVTQGMQIFQPYIPAAPLSLFNRNNLSEQLNGIIDAADVAGLAHCADVAHRDLKPGNILDLSSQNDHAGKPQVMIIDFGFSGSRNNRRGIHSRFCTTSFASPQRLKEGHDPTDDVYALAGSLYFFLTGKFPYLETYDASIPNDWDLLAKLKKYGSLQWGVLPQYEAQLPMAVRSVVDRALHPNPKYRPSLIDFRNELAQAAGLPLTKGWKAKQYTS